MIVTVVGLAFEARIAARAGMRAVCGGDGRNLATSLNHAVMRGCSGLISFGVVGLFVGPVILAATYTLAKEWVARV